MNVQYLRNSLLEVLCKIGGFRNFAKFTRNHLCQNLFFNKVAGNFIEKGTLTQEFSLNFEKFLRTTFLTEHLRWLLLNTFNGFGIQLLLSNFYIVA